MLCGDSFCMETCCVEEKILQSCLFNRSSLCVMIHQVNEHEIHQSLLKADSPKRKYAVYSKQFLSLNVISKQGGNSVQRPEIHSCSELCQMLLSFLCWKTFCDFEPGSGFSSRRRQTGLVE